MVNHPFELKTGHEFEDYEFISTLAFYKYHPERYVIIEEDIQMKPFTELAKRGRDIYESIRAVRQTIRYKISRNAHNEFVRHKETMWPLTMALASRTKSKIGELSPELIQKLQKHSWDEYHSRPRSYLAQR